MCIWRQRPPKLILLHTLHILGIIHVLLSLNRVLFPQHISTVNPPSSIETKSAAPALAALPGSDRPCVPALGSEIKVTTT